MTDVAQPIAGALWLRLATPTYARIRQPFAWRPYTVVSGAPPVTSPGLVATMFDATHTQIGADIAVTLGREFPLFASLSYGSGQTDPAYVKLDVINAGEDTGTYLDFGHLDVVSVGRIALWDQGPQDTATVDRYDWPVGATGAGAAPADGVVLRFARPLVQSYTQDASQYMYRCWSHHHLLSLLGSTHTATAGRHCTIECTWRHRSDAHYEVTQIPCHVVLRPPWRTLVADVLRGRSPEIIDPLAAYASAAGVTADEALALAWESVIERMLSNGLWPDLLRNQSQMEGPTEWALRLHMAERGLVPSAERRNADTYRDRLEGRLAAAFEAMTQRRDWWYDENDDQAADTTEQERAVSLHQGW